ncbi:hypothetical protein EPUS_05307 [Endocarpon pusillum Z07020]|uniref:RING-type domain-containing protein n=1 Tax=Endocarpon pusillum (strain Z07020 / HMAS-L-300199) TaxID=1263415 RepID=U1HLV2_ENDPU|nr:uncharacterized protein EPUS_05307 [Endocarpon pusillum Z07020]ERF71255.1 hypothetical protein EPUS_05307 [Endocarpon pusillum Z07020]
MASSQTLELNDASKGPSDPCDVIEATLWQPDLKDELNGIYREMGLGQDIAAAFPNLLKRPIEEVSEAEVTPLPRKERSRKPKDADSNKTALEGGEPENEKPKKDKPVVKFNKLLYRTAVSKIPGFTWCIAPGCEYGQVYHRGGQEETDAWHEGQTCLEYQENGRLESEPTPRDFEIAIEEQKSKETLKAQTRRCPGSGCGVPIMQYSMYGGCDKMKCSMCQLEFCWRCGADYRTMKANKRSAHKENCYWHKRIFKLWRRAPGSAVVAEWEGMPQTTISNASYLKDYNDTSYRGFHDMGL